MKEYIHYGSNKFDPEMFKPIDMNNPYMSSLGINKPKHGIGLWASPVDIDYGWKEWCEAEDFHTDRLNESFTFTLKPTAKILVVQSLDDIEPYVKKWCDINSDFLRYESISNSIDFIDIAKTYDGVELIHGDNYTDLHYSVFYSWDVDSIVVWNKVVIVPL